jgi:hypothetical protein
VNRTFLTLQFPSGAELRHVEWRFLEQVTRESRGALLADKSIVLVRVGVAITLACLLGIQTLSSINRGSAALTSDAPRVSGVRKMKAPSRGIIHQWRRPTPASLDGEVEMACTCHMPLGDGHCHLPEDLKGSA